MGGTRPPPSATTASGPSILWGLRRRATLAGMSTKNKSRLGRGLSSLLSMPELPAAEADIAPPSPSANALRATDSPADGELFHVELSRVAVNPHQPRRVFDEAELAGLAESLKGAGLIQPIVVRPVEGGYELIAGERRLRAAKLAGLTHVPALLRHVRGAQQAELALVENIQRANLNPMERAQAYGELLRQTGLTQDGLAQRLGEDRSTIANHLRLLDLCEPARILVADGTLSLGHAKLLAGVHDLLIQQRLAEQAASQQLSVRGLEPLVQQATKGLLAPSTATKPTPHIVDLEQRLSRDLQMRVQVRQGGKKGQGRLVIHYGSLDQFDDLVARLGLRTED
jgi:ParB family chromosome partitioning protein